MCNNADLNSFLSCSIRNSTLVSISLLFTIKIDGFLPFLQVLFPTAIIENQLHNFLIKSRHSCKRFCSHNCTF